MKGEMKLAGEVPVMADAGNGGRIPLMRPFLCRKTMLLRLEKMMRV